LYNKITSKKKKKGGAKTIGIKKRKYSKEQKEEMVQKALSGKSILALGKENKSPLDLSTAGGDNT